MMNKYKKGGYMQPSKEIKFGDLKRKATDGSFTSDIIDETERKKYLGSYYSVSDYKEINQEFGSKTPCKRACGRDKEAGGGKTSIQV